MANVLFICILITNVVPKLYWAKKVKKKLKHFDFDNSDSAAKLLITFNFDKSWDLPGPISTPSFVLAIFIFVLLRKRNNKIRNPIMIKSFC